MHEDDWCTKSNWCKMLIDAWKWWLIHITDDAWCHEDDAQGWLMHDVRLMHEVWLMCTKMIHAWWCLMHKDDLWFLKMINACLIHEDDWSLMPEVDWFRRMIDVWRCLIIIFFDLKVYRSSTFVVLYFPIFVFLCFIKNCCRNVRKRHWEWHHRE